MAKKSQFKWWLAGADFTAVAKKTCDLLITDDPFSEWALAEIFISDKSRFCGATLLHLLCPVAVPEEEEACRNAVGEVFEKARERLRKLNILRLDSLLQRARHEWFSRQHENEVRTSSKYLSEYDPITLSELKFLVSRNKSDFNLGDPDLWGWEKNTEPDTSSLLDSLFVDDTKEQTRNMRAIFLLQFMINIGIESPDDALMAAYASTAHLAPRYFTLAWAEQKKKDWNGVITKALISVQPCGAERLQCNLSRAFIRQGADPVATGMQAAESGPKDGCKARVMGNF